MSRRYALYYAPGLDTELWRAGSSLLGYDAASGAEVAPPLDMPFGGAEWRLWTEEPRRYGFHATLKAPFELAEAIGEADVMRCAAELAATTPPVPLPALAVQAIGAFTALAPVASDDALSGLAQACVEALEPVRAPLSEADRARRRPERLSERQRAYLDRYGYPYVGDEFRFHMTLTGPLPTDMQPPVVAWLTDVLAAVPRPAAIDSLVIVVQPDRASRFRIIRRIPLGG